MLTGPDTGNPTPKKQLRGEEDIGNPDGHESAILLFWSITLDKDKNILP
jgi:hypothetical protein